MFNVIEVYAEEHIRKDINSDFDKNNLGITNSELGNSLTGYLTVVAILIASAGFTFALAPNIGAEVRSKFKVLSFLLSFSAAAIVGLGIGLIIYSQMYFYNLIAFVILIIPIETFMFLSVSNK